MTDNDSILASLGPSPELIKAIADEVRNNPTRAKAQHDKLVKRAPRRFATETPYNPSKRLKEKLDRAQNFPRVRPVHHQYQIRKIAGTRQYGLYCPDEGDQHWYADFAYKALNGMAAKKFNTTEAARTFRSKISAPVKEES